MTELADRLERVLSQESAGRASAGLVVAPVGSMPTVVWTPHRDEQEPGFLAYSVTKSFGAVLMLMLQEDGRLSLEERLARWFPKIPGAERISLRQVLQHSAGLRDYGALGVYQAELRATPSEPWSFERFLAETVAKGLLFEPGEGWSYANPGYMLLRKIAEEVTGSPYSNLLEERITKPLGLGRTFLAEAIGDLASLAPAPSSLLSNDDRLKDARAAYHPGWVSHGVLASTGSELAGFFAALFGGRLLAEESLRQMTRLAPVPSAGPAWREPSYGLGLMADPASRWGPIFGHAGSGPGYDAHALFAPGLCGGGVAVCAMCASEQDASAQRLVFDALDLLVWEFGSHA